MLRLMVTGWLFALVVTAAWIGVITPTPSTPMSGGETTAVPGLISEMLGQIGHRQGNMYLPSGNDPGSCPLHLTRGPSFGPNQVGLNPAGEEVLTAAMTELIEMSCLTDPIGRTCRGLRAEISVEGHTDDLPSSRHGGNQQLSHDRARSVADWLSAAGFTIRSVDGLGSSQPAPAPGPDTRDAAERRRDDRRVSLRAWCPRP
ncbi:MAG: OmpA family protein [Actinomycetia bacterium]|nr:OmpA family protein [Actinomycetes bacterium]